MKSPLTLPRFSSKSGRSAAPRQTLLGTLAAAARPARRLALALRLTASRAEQQRGNRAAAADYGWGRGLFGAAPGWAPHRIRGILRFLGPGLRCNQDKGRSLGPA